jgi:hypothetical protein
MQYFVAIIIVGGLIFLQYIGALHPTSTKGNSLIKPPIVTVEIEEIPCNYIDSYGMCRE